MIAYIDSSVVLRIVLGQAGALAEWKAVRLGVTSGLTEVECLRAMDRLRILGMLTLEESASGREAVYRIMHALEVVELTSAVMRRASQPMPAPLGTLDAIHLATADLWRDARREDPVVATHDRALALAARASGFEVIGI